jgi:EpsI family protein
MAGLTRRETLMAGAMLATGVAGLAARPRAQAPPLAREELAALLPDRIGNRRFAGRDGLVLPTATPEVERTYAATATALYRTIDAPMVMLLVAQGQADSPGMSVHRPERCYPAAGFAMGPSRKIALEGFPAVQVEARRAERREQILYWIRTGDAFPQSAIEQRMAVLGANLAGVQPVSLLMRLSLVSPDGEAARAAMSEFHRQWLAALPRLLRSALLGVRA